MNDTMRLLIRQRMEQLGISQSALAQLISEARGDGKKVERVTINRALNHAGAGANIMEEILEALDLELTVKPSYYRVYPANPNQWKGANLFTSRRDAEDALAAAIGTLQQPQKTDSAGGRTWHYQNNNTIVRAAIDNLEVDYPQTLVDSSESAE